MYTGIGNLVDKEEKMKKIAIVSCSFALAILLGLGSVVYAQSSGNFSARIATAQCVINDTTGELSGGLTNTLLETTIKTPNSGQTALVIRPSLLTGLFTRTKVDNTTALGSATAIAGVRVRVLIDGKVVAPGTPVGAIAGDEDGWIYYDKRFQKLSSNIPSFLGADCNADPLIIEPCYIELILSTLNAGSFDFVVADVGGGDHTLKVEWELIPTAATANEAACVGPGVLTVQQVKTFSTGGGIVITPDN